MQFLIRRVAQSLLEEVFDDCELVGMPDLDEALGARGKHPASMTLTSRPRFAAALAARRDPRGILGLARVMGPAFRARFQEAFDLFKARSSLISMAFRGPLRHALWLRNLVYRDRDAV